VCLLALACANEESATRYTESFAASGQEWYVTYCASCHGADAGGDGPAAEALVDRPTDLTRIAARNEGQFDAAGVASYIDGRSVVVAHGPREMPVWGRRFDDRGESLAEETRLAPGSILLIVEYLRSIQLPVERLGGDEGGS
jgi:mono/diheme cytochrome c family protein